MSSLRIVHVTPYSAGAWAYGGIARLVATLTRGLARKGHRVTVCTTDVCDQSARLAGRPNSARFRPWLPICTADGVEVRVFPNLSNRLAYHFQTFLPLGFDDFMRQHAGTFDVAHLHACRNFPGAIAAHHLHRAGVPYVLAPNGTAPRIERRQLAKRGFDAVIGQRILDNATRVLAVSDVERRQLNALGVPREAIALIPNPVDLYEFSRPVKRRSFRERFGIGSGPLVLFLGKLTPRKRVDVVVQAVAQLRCADAWLAVAGNDMGGGAPARALVAALDRTHLTRFTGLLTGHERLEALADADVLVYPSQHEIFGLVPLEALLSGTPVIVADDSGCAEIIAATGGGQVVPVGESRALAQAIDRVLEAPAAWRRAARAAAQNVRALYNEETVCAQLEDMYRDMVA